MSRKGLAYLSLGIETVERFNALFKRADGRGRRSKHGGFCARPGRLRARPSGLGRTDRSGAGVRRIACLYFAADPRLGGAGGDRRADRRQRNQLLAGPVGRRGWRRARRLSFVLVRLQIQGTRRADVAAVALSGDPAAWRSLCEELGRAEHFHRAVFRTAAALGAARCRDIRDAILAFSIRQFLLGAGVVGGALAVRRRDRANRRMAVAYCLKLAFRLTLPSASRGISRGARVLAPSNPCAAIASLLSRRGKNAGKSGRDERPGSAECRTEFIVALGGHQQTTDTPSRTRRCRRVRGYAAITLHACERGRAGGGQAGAEFLSLQGRRQPGHGGSRRQKYLPAGGVLHHQCEEGGGQRRAREGVSAA